MSPRVPEVEMLSTCGRGPGAPQVGPGPPRAYPDPRELLAQLLLGRGPETPRVTQTRAQAQAFRWKLPHPPALSASG